MAASMKAWVLTSPGGPDKLQLQDLPIPEIAANEVLVKATAIGINPIDWKTCAGGGRYEALLASGRPIILGWDLAGEVVAVGQSVARFAVGDLVFGLVNFPGAGRCFAEFVSAPENHLAKIPLNLNAHEAAAAALAGLTAMQALRTMGGLKQKKLLIHAAAGGVGHIAVQLAVIAGAEVFGTAQTRHHTWLKDLGARQLIDYTQQKFEDVLPKVDLVLDCIGGPYIERSLQLLHEGGQIVSIVSATNAGVEALAAQYKCTGRKFIVYSNGEDMAHLAGLLATNQLKIKTGPVVPFTQLPNAEKVVAL